MERVMAERWWRGGGGRMAVGVGDTIYSASSALLEYVCMCTCMLMCALTQLLNVIFIFSLVSGCLLATDIIATELQVEILKLLISSKTTMKNDYQSNF